MPPRAHMFFCKLFWNRKHLRLRLDAHCVMGTIPMTHIKYAQMTRAKLFFCICFADPNRLGQSLLELCMLHMTCKLTQQLQYFIWVHFRVHNYLAPRLSQPATGVMQTFLEPKAPQNSSWCTVLDLCCDMCTTAWLTCLCTQLQMRKCVPRLDTRFFLFITMA